MKLVLLCLSLLVFSACESASDRAPERAAPNAAVEEDLTAIIIGGSQCGNAVCGKRQFCCNASCSTCAPLGGACTQQVCETTVRADEAPADELPAEEAPADEACDDAAAGDDDLVAAGGTCGGRTCPKGTWCCNASCARCVPVGMQCTQESCN